MIQPVKSTRITLNHGTPGWGKFGKHCGTDFGVPVGTPVYAPGVGTIRATYFGPSGGNMMEVAIGNYWHRFLHLDRYVRKTGAVKEGELIAYSGATGKVTGPHLHWDVRKAGTTWDAAYSNYVDPMSLITKGEQPMTPEQEAQAYQIVLGRNPEGAPSGRTGWQFIIGAKPEVEAQRAAHAKMVADLQKALENAKNKPAEKVIVQVEKIVEKAAPADEKAVVEGVIRRFWNSLFKGGKS